MAKSIHLRLTGEAEKFIAEMQQHGLTEADIFARSIYLLQQVWRTKRVALIKEDVGREVEAVEYFFGIQTHNQPPDVSTIDAFEALKQKSKRRNEMSSSSINDDIKPGT